MTGENLITEYGKLLVDVVLAIATITFGISTYKKASKIRALEDEKEYLKRKIHKVSSKVDPESDRKLLMKAERSVQIMGINSLGPLHHCREEMIEFLVGRKGILQIVLLDPQSDIFAMREQREKDLSKRLLSEWRASLSILKDIQINTQGKIELKLRSDPPDRSLFIVDAIDDLTDRTKMLVNYYPEEPATRGYSGAQFLAEFLMERDRDSIFKNNDYFLLFWNKSQTVAVDAAIELGVQQELTRRSS